MGITRTASRCWLLTRPDGSRWDDGDGEPHYDTEAKGRVRADEEGALGLLQLEQPCWVAESQCGEEFSDGDVYGQTHYDTEAELRMGLEVSEWRVSEDGTVRCPLDCGPCDCDDDPDDED